MGRGTSVLQGFSSPPAGSLPLTGIETAFSNINVSAPRHQYHGAPDQNIGATCSSSGSARPNSTDPYPDNFDCPSNEIPSTAHMSIVDLGPTRADCNIQFSHPGMDPPLSIPVKRDPKERSAWGSTRTAATGVLRLPLKLPVKATVSGWSQTSNYGHQLNDRYWKDRVLEMCEAIGYELAKNASEEPSLDLGQTLNDEKPGTYQASHVEKQFLAYVFFTHMFQSKRRATGNATGWEQTYDGPPVDEMDRGQTFDDLFTQEHLTNTPREVTIYVGQSDLSGLPAMC